MQGQANPVHFSLAHQARNLRLDKCAGIGIWQADIEAHNGEVWHLVEGCAAVNARDIEGQARKGAIDPIQRSGEPGRRRHRIAACSKVAPGMGRPPADDKVEIARPLAPRRQSARGQGGFVSEAQLRPFPQGRQERRRGDRADFLVRRD